MAVPIYLKLLERRRTTLPIRRAGVFLSGQDQAVIIPAEYRFASDELFLRHDPQSGEITLSEYPLRPSLVETFAMIDAAGGGDDLLRDRDVRHLGSSGRPGTAWR